MNCQSCGMPMATDQDHGGGRPDNVYCVHCTDEAGNLKPKEEVREGMISFYMQTMNKPREEAEREVDAHMAQMSAWSASQPTVPAAEPQVANEAPVVSVPEEVVQTPVVETPAETVQDEVEEMPAPLVPEAAPEVPSVEPASVNVEPTAPQVYPVSQPTEVQTPEEVTSVPEVPAAEPAEEVNITSEGTAVENPVVPSVDTPIAPVEESAQVVPTESGVTPAEPAPSLPGQGE